ncbi:3-deoxy-7-phosphoheptulonate synthase [Geoalkalibacter subterraneus]|uniref:3-deoxy-7-phosphoheptulonate synthase n=1 Tax=Geoalkalibacter subterraneus TaxID=483547 RepID=A0A0B5FET4_9BACT|nr:3-deoxy-7-phosphoheptulonate synthase [Geoalkalibacter subterraneus]AJF05833.1 3-deoxy-7-phosphoheptulonate synthase [Geoalkalibacter subterraneus]
MLIVMEHNASAEQVRRVQETIETMGLQAAPIPGSERTAIGVLGNQGYVDDTAIRNLPGVRECIHVSKPYKLVSRDFHPGATIVEIGDVRIGDGMAPVVIAGPCSIESVDQMMAAARMAKKAGASMLRGGAFKPRTGPHSFQGLGEKGLKMLRQAGDQVGLPVITEVMRIEQLDAVCQYADVLQIGARNMQNFDLLKEVGRLDRPVLLKRGMSATVEEFLAAAEYIVAEGNERVVLCERGIRTFERATRNTLDLSVVPLIREMSHLPIIVDPSHATGLRSLVPVMSKAALVAGAHGVMVEVHPDPARALCDGAQSLDGPAFESLMSELRGLAAYLGHDL